ncbi:hypothetical protein V6N13_008134 [Hibiscus sabdariffa]|uniref:Uncharacterized protein n=1 Tax=Hibiscus sabdariffa TaxID=183260 RepID=A0ABR2ECB0_9ROSI
MVLAYEESNEHIDEKSCTYLRTTDNIACHRTTHVASKLHPLNALIISNELEPERRVFHATRVNPYAQFAWTTTFWIRIVQQTPTQSLFYLSGPGGTSGTARVGTKMMMSMLAMYRLMLLGSDTIPIDLIVHRDVSRSLQRNLRGNVRLVVIAMCRLRFPSKILEIIALCST